MSLKKNKRILKIAYLLKYGSYVLITFHPYEHINYSRTKNISQEKEKSFKKVTTHLFFVGRCLFLVNITLENGSWKRASFYKRFSV